MLAAEAVKVPFLHHADLRPILSNGPDYKDDWANELHPEKEAFQRLATALASQIP